MPKFVQKLIHSALSDRELELLHDQRRLLLKEFKEAIPRKKYAVVVCLALAVLAFTCLMAAAWVPPDISGYLKSRSNIITVKEDAITWSASPLSTIDCADDIQCLTPLAALLKPTRLSDIDKTVNHDAKPQFMMMRIAVAAEAFENLDDANNYILAIPSFVFKRAFVFYNNMLRHTFFAEDRLYLAIELNEVSITRPMIMDVYMEIKPSDLNIAGIRNQQGVFLASKSEYDAFVRFQEVQKSGSVGRMGQLAKIVVALFCLLLFLIVDSSPESLGLALFMGFEAAAMGLDQSWLPVELRFPGAFTNFFYQMGDLFKFYFLMQLARVGVPNAGRWLLVCTAVSIPYGIFMYQAGLEGINWVRHIPLVRDIFVGTVGGFLCFRTLFFLRLQTLPWRKAALIVAGTAGLFEGFNSWIGHSDWVRSIPEVTTLFSVLQANIGYMFALSTYLNISTLENRVHTLSKERDRAHEVKRQLELGRSVQQAFLTLPKLPRSLRVSCHYEAAEYVSGDTYFVHWDKERRVLTLLLNDVTGHGVQAALKAFASNMIAKTIWPANAEKIDEENVADFRRRKERRKVPSKLEIYDQTIDELLCHNESTPDFNAMIGVEFYLNEGKIGFFRSNYNFPIVVEPKFPWRTQNVAAGPADKSWESKVLAIPNKTYTEYDIKEGAYLVLLSDGFVTNSRAQSAVVEFIETLLSNDSRSSGMNANQLQDTLIKRFREENLGAEIDDRTILVFQWDTKMQDDIVSGDEPNVGPPADPTAKSA